MKKESVRKQTPAGSNRKKASAIPRSTRRALVPLDTEKIRREEYRKLERGRAACARAEAELVRFEQHEQKAYSRWIHAECGPLLEDLRKAGSEAMLTLQTIDLARELKAFYPRRKMHECADAADAYYASQGQAPAGFEKFFRPPENHCDPDRAEWSRGGFADEEDDEEFEDEEEIVDEFLRDVFGMHGFGEWAEESGKVARQGAKELYRKIARNLHPDRDAASNPQRLALWHEAQQAYENHDVETLERILADCDLLDPASAKTSPVSSIRAGIGQFKRGLAALRSRIRAAKRQPEWGFLAWNESRKARELARARRSIQLELSDISAQATCLKIKLQRMRTPAAPQAPRKKTIRRKNDDPPFHAEFDFF